MLITFILLYVLSPNKWDVSEVGYYITPRTTSSEAATNAIQYAAEGWNAAGASIKLKYLGSSTVVGAVKDGLSTISFTSEVHPKGYAASTYCWWDSKNIKSECDVIFYEKSFRFFVAGGCVAGTGTTRGAYIEQYMAHEWGHVLGLQHTTVSGATMQASAAQCALTWLTLSTDDKNGLHAQYPVKK